MNKLPKKPRNDNLYKAILKLESFDECVRFFEDLCTRAELMAMEQRYQVASLLHQGMIYNDILARTGASSGGSYTRSSGSYSSGGSSRSSGGSYSGGSSGSSGGGRSVSGGSHSGGGRR